MGVKGQFFVVSTVIIVLAISTTLLYLLFPYGLSIGEINRVTNALINAKNFVLALEESEAMMNSWDEPFYTERLDILIDNAGSQEISGLLSAEVDLGVDSADGLRVVSGGVEIPFSYETALSGETLFFNGLVPALGSSVFKVYYSRSSRPKTVLSGDSVVYDGSSGTVMTRFYSARVNTDNGGIIDSLINGRNGNELANTSSGFFSLYFSGLYQDSDNLTLHSFRQWSTPLSHVVRFNLTDNYTLNLEVTYEFFEKNIRARFVCKNLLTPYSGFTISVHPGCSHDWTLESHNGSVISNYCSNLSGFNNLKTGEVLSLYSSSESLALLSPARSAYGAGVTFIDLGQKALPGSGGLEFSYSFDDSTALSTAELVLLMESNQTGSGYAHLFKNSFLEPNMTAVSESLDESERAFISVLESTMSLSGGSIFANPFFQESSFQSEDGQFNWFKQVWNVTRLRLWENAGLDRVNEVVKHSFNDYFTDFFVTNSLGVKVPSAVVDEAGYRTIYFLANVSEKSYGDYLVYRSNNSLVPVITGANNLALTSSGDGLVFFNGFFDNVSLSLDDDLIRDLVVNEMLVKGVVNDFRVGVNNEFKSLSSGDFEVVNTSSSNNALFAGVEQNLRLKEDGQVTVNSRTFFFDDYLMSGRVFTDNSSARFIGHNSLFWGSNLAEFPVFNNTNMTDYYYEGAWNGSSVVDPNPLRTGGPGDGKYFSVMYWGEEGFFITSAARVHPGTDLLTVDFGLANGLFPETKQKPYWTQYGDYNRAGLDVALAFGWGGKDYALNFSGVFYEKFSNPLTVSKVYDYVDYSNRFENLLSVRVNNSAGELLNHPLELSVKNFEGSLSSARLSVNNELLESELVSSELSFFGFHANVKNFDVSSPVRYAFYNPVNRVFNVSTVFTGGFGVSVDYSITNPAGFVFESGVYNASRNFTVANASPGFYVFEFLSSGEPSSRSYLDVDSTLTQGCLLADRFGFSGNQEFWFYAPPSSSSMRFDLFSSGTGAVWKYSVYDENSNYLTGNAFPQGGDISVAYNFESRRDGRFFRIVFEYNESFQPITWLTVTLKQGLSNCIGFDRDNWINYYSPSVTLLSFVDFQSGEESEFSVLSDNYALARQEVGEKVSWSEQAKSLNNGFMVFDYDNLSLSVLGSGNWLGSWSTQKSVSYSNFSNAVLVENGSLRKVVSADSGVFKYYFTNYGGQDFFGVRVSNYSFDNSVINISLRGRINSTDDYWFKFYGYSEGTITGTHSLGFDGVKCLNGYTYFGKKDSYFMLAIVLPCDSLAVENNVMQVQGDGLSFKLSGVRDNEFFVKTVYGYDWRDVEGFINSLGSVKESSSRIDYTWGYYSEDLLIS